MIGNCDNCGHSFAYHVPLAGCAKCSCSECVIAIATALFGWIP